MANEGLANMLAVGNIIGKRKVRRQSKAAEQGQKMTRTAEEGGGRSRRRKVTAELGGGGSVVVGGSGAGSGGGRRWQTKAAEGI